MNSVHRHKSPIYAAALFISLLLLTCEAGSSSKGSFTLGILPTFNAGGDSFGVVFGEHLALKLFEELKSASIHPVLLNPGGYYNATDDDWLLDYGHQSGANALLITSLLKTEMPSNGNWTIIVQTEILDLKSGKRSEPWRSMIETNKHNVQLDYGILHTTVSSRIFEKQPLGKAMAAIAGQIRARALQEIHVENDSANEVRESSGACDVSLKVLYSSKHAASKSYTVFVDGKEESLSVDNGVLPLLGRSGLLLLQVKINDAPYKLPTQELYQIGEYVDCSKPQRELVMKIGAAGEALLEWH